MAGVIQGWKSLGGTARASLMVGAVVIVAFTAVAFWWLAGEDYQVLFGDLEPNDAAKVLKSLEEMKVDYRLADGGTKIQVPESSVHEVRLKVMGSGVPLVGGAGFEIFDDSDFGMTEFSQRINYQRALEGELTRTIVSLKEVKYARVHLVMPERGLFKQNDNSPSASVTLFLHPGTRPMPQQVMGIQRLVAAAVPMLTPSQVTVTDQNGLTLSQSLSAQDGAATVTGRLQQKQAVEEYLMAKANEVVVRHFGTQQALVSIDAELDFNQIKRTRENVLPLTDQKESGVVRRRETRKNYGAAARERQGDVTTEVEYRLGRDIEQIVQSPGRIMRLSVGIMVPSSVSNQQREGIRELVKMAVGYNEARGDALAIYAMSASAGPLSTGSDDMAGSPIPHQTPARSGSESSLKDSGTSVAPEMDNLLTYFSKWPSAIMQAPAAAQAVVLAVLVLGVVILAISLKRRQGRYIPPRLSDVDRQRILTDVHQWLEGAETAQGSESV